MTIRRQNRQGIRRGKTDCSEGYRLLCAVLASIQILLPTLAAALPTDGHVVAGQATIQQDSPTTLSITQASDKSILNWNSFSIAGNESVHFIQPSVSSISLNRVIGVDPSVILGQLQSNGSIFLINPNGILFGTGAQINVGGLLATTLQTRDDDFMAGHYLFAQDPLKGLKTVVNRGNIHVSDNGYVVLMAPGVSNEGVIVANLGTALLGSGQKFTLDLMGDGLIRYAINDNVLGRVTGPDGKQLTSAVSNSGSIQADGGHVILSARASGDVFSSVVNQSGVIRAQSLVNHGGVVRLEGSDPVANIGSVGWQANLGKVQNAEGKVINIGTIDVSAVEPGAAQGQVTITGEIVGIAGTILARGADGAQGGRVLLSSTEKTIATSDSVIDTSGVGNSSAGNVVVWSDKNTMFGGMILAQGGALGGNGGNIEVSGHENLGFFGQVNALAPKGVTGTLLLDPLTITVATGGGATLVQVDQFSDTPAVAQTIDPATINAAAANVTLQANNDITVTNAIAMTNNGVGITMQAGRDILVNAGVSTTNGNISLTANDSTAIAANRTGGTTGDIVFGAAGNLSAGTGNITLTINPSAAAPFSPGSITTVRNLTTTIGNISINSPNTVSLSGAVNAGSGTVTINANTDGAGAQAFTMNAGSSITTTNTTAGAVQINVNAAGGGTGTAALDNITVPVAGTLTVATNTGGNLTGGAITQNAGTSLNVGTAQISTGNGAIMLNNAGNDFGTAAVSRATNVTLQDANALTLAASTVSGTLNVTTNGAITDSGNLVVTGATTLAAGAGNNITLDNANNFSTVAVTSGNNVTLNDTNALILGASTVSGTLGVTTVGALTQSGALTVTGVTTLDAGAANNITLNNAGNNFNTVGITSGNNVTLNDTNALILGASTVSGTLGVTTVGALTQSGAVSVVGATTLATGAANSITLNNAANDFSTVGITTGNNVALTDANALVLGASTVNGTLGVTTAGALTQSGVLTVTGVTTLAAGAANSINLATSANNFSTVAITSGNNVSLRDANALVLGTSTVNGALALTTGGALTQSGALNVTGATSFTATAANTDILLGTQANNFGGALSFAGTLGNFRDVSIRNVNVGATVPALAGLTALRNLTLTYNNAPVTLPALTLTAGGSLNITAGGAITDSGNLVVPGTTTLVAGANNITLDNANNFTGAVSIVSGNNVTLNDINALVLAPSTVSGTLNVTSAGAVTQTGALAVTGATTVAAGAANNITLNNAANDFSTVGITSGNSVALTDANALDMGASTVSGTLNVTTNGTLTQSGALAVTGTTTLAAGAANNITLNNTANNFSTVGITSGNNVTLVNVNALNLAASTVSGTLNVTAGGLIGQSGALSVAGNANFDTTAAATLGSVTLANGGGLTLGTSTVGGNLVATTTAGDFTLPVGQTLTIVGDATLAPAGNVNLLGTTRIGGTQASVGGTGSTFVLGADTNLNALALPAAGDITVNTTGVTATFAGGPLLPQAITLNSAGNNFGGPVSVTTATPAFTGTTTNTYNLTQSAPVSLNAGQTMTVTDLGGTAGTRGNITLTNAGNSFDTVNFTGGNIAWQETNAVTIGAVSANAGITSSGALSITAAGPLTQTGAVTAAGLTTLAAGGNDITLTNATNNFTTVGITSGNSVSLTDANALMLGASTVSGNFALTTGGTLSQTGALAVTGATSFTATAANTDILFDTQTNNFGGALSFAGAQTNFRDVQLRNVNAGATVPVLAGLTNLRNLTLTFDNAPITLPALTANGALNITAGGSINQSGVLAIGGTAMLATTVAGSDILLDTQANNLGSTVSFGGTFGNIRDVGLRNTNAGATIPSLAGLTNLRNLTVNFDNAPVALSSLTLTAGGNLNVTAGGSITEIGTVTVPGTTTLTTTAAGSDILLDTQANNFGGAIAFGGTKTNIRDLGLRNVNVGATVPALAGLTNLRNLTLTFDTAPMVLPSLTASGNLTATAGGLISQSGALNVAGAASFDTLAAATLGSVTLANGGALTLNTSTVGGNLTVTTAAGDLTLPASQTLTVVGDATLSPSGTVNLLGTTRIGGTQSSVGGTGSTFVLGADTNLNALALPAAGDITVNTTGITASFAGAPLFPQAITLGNAGNSFGGPVSVTTAAPVFTGTTTNTYNLTQSAPVNLNVGQGLTVTDLGGTAGTRGNITLTNAGNSFNTVNFTGGNIAWQEANAVTIGGVSANAGITSSGVLSITAAGPLTQTGVVTAAGTTSLAAGGNDITLTNGANNFSTIGITSGNNVTLTDANTLNLAASTVSGSFGITTNGDLTQSGALNITGTATLAAGAANDITLTNGVNDFSTVGITSGNNVALTDSNVLVLGASSVSGNLTVTSGGSLTQSGALIVTGTTNLASTAANSDILLDTQANNFGGAVAFGGTQANIRDVSLRNVNAGATVSALAGLTNLRKLTLTFDAAPINLPTLNASGNLSATAGGSITQSGTLTIGGATTLATTVAGSDILLDTQANNLGGAVGFGGAQTNIRDIGLRNLNASATIPALAGVTNLRDLTLTFDNAPIALPSLTTSGNLSATAGGAITQTGALTIAGITALAAGINDITLTNGANNFSTVGITSGNDVSLVNSNALGLGASTVTGNLNVTTGGALAQSGALTVAGATTLVAGANDITLNSAGNNFSTVGVTSGNNVVLTDANVLTITASTVSGNFSANAGDLTVGGPVVSTGGNLNLTGANTVTQLANLTAAGANTVTVTTAGGSITMGATATTTSGTGDINYTAGTDVTLGSLSTGGGVNVSAGDSVLSAAGSGTNVTAGANSTLQAFNGVVGTQAAPVTVNINPGTLSIRATTAVAGISAFLTGTMLPSNALMLLNVPPGLVCFNGCPVTGGLAGLLGNAFGTLAYLNPDAIVPAYYPQPSRSVLISDITSVYIPGALLQPSPVSLSSGSPAVQSMEPKASVEASCNQEAAASSDMSCAVQ